MTDTLQEILEHTKLSDARYGDFASTHEALGVMLEEWSELQDAVKANAIESIRDEAIDLAAVCYRLAIQCRASEALRKRSIK